MAGTYFSYDFTKKKLLIKLKHVYINIKRHQRL